jgi:transcriptional regulator with XRE-family HTH domain
VSIVDYSATLGVSSEASVPPTNRVLHRLGKVRRLQGVSRRLLARHLNVEVAEIRRQEESADLPISVLYAWQKVLEVPVAELLLDSDENLSRPLLERARLVRLMKTALALVEQADGPAVRSLAQTLADQLTKIMPELSGISPWHLVGQRRRRDELGIAAMRTLSEDVLANIDE